MMRPQQSLVAWALAPALVLGPMLTCGIPRVMAPLFILSAVLAVGVDMWERRLRPAFDRALALLFGAAVLFGAASYAWTINPDATFGKAGQLAMMFAGVALLVPVVRRMDLRSLTRVGHLTMIGLGLGLAMYINESVHHFPFYDGLRGGSSPDVVDVKQNKATVLNALWLFLAAPFFWLRGGSHERRLFAWVMVPVVYITWHSLSASAQVVFLAATLLAAILWVLPVRLTLVLTLAVTAGLSLGMPWVARALDTKTEWEQNASLNDSIKSRIEIWDQAARRSFEKPVLGWGLDSAPKLPNRGERSYLAAYRASATNISHLHPHNGPLQIWFEMGAVGAAMLATLFVLFYRRLRAMADRTAQCYGQFIWAACFLYTLSIWGIWQSWFVATLCFAGVVGYAGVRYIALAPKVPFFRPAER